MHTITCRQVAYGTSAYEDTVALRYAVLRKPLGLTFTDEQLRLEKNDHHLALYLVGGLAACLVLTKVNDEEIKMRQVAVRDDIQGKGIGKQLVKFSEDFAREKGFSLMTLHARETAVPFYLAMNYQTKGQPFIEVGLPHRAMYKSLL